jgi:hypothetical protein
MEGIPMINTPLLDAAIQSTDEKLQKRHPRSPRWVNAKADIVEGIQNKMIWNVDFVSAKENLSRGIDAVVNQIFDAALPEYWRISELDITVEGNYELQERMYKAHKEFSLSCQMNQAAGRIKRLEKFMDFKDVPHYVEVLKEVVLLHEACQAAKPFIKKGRKPAENSVPFDFTNTGQCAICGKIQKMTGNKKMVHHGFEISGGTGHYYGFRAGSCFGVGYEPRELSCTANLAYIPVLEKNLADAEVAVARLRNNEPEMHVAIKQRREGFRMVDYKVEYPRGTPEYARLNESAINQVQFEIRGLEQAIMPQKHNVSIWERKPLYDEKKG